MINFTPNMPDNKQYYILVPQRDTLYGSIAIPLQYIRVLDSSYGSVRSSVTMQADPDDPSTMFTVEDVDLKTFLEYASYGYTPYLEVAFCGLQNAQDFGDVKEFLVSQAALRNYEKRSRELLEILESKKLSIAARTSTTSTERLIAELRGCLTSWEILMNTGNIAAANCLSYADESIKNGTFPVKKLREKFLELIQRMYMNNTVNLPYKITADKRDRLLKAFK